MRSEYLPFALPDIGIAEIAEVESVLRSGWLTTGPKVAAFEAAFAEAVGARHAIALNSCTAALHLALESLGIAPGDEIITTPYTFAATGEVIHYLGATPVLVDVDPETLNIDPEQVRNALTDRTRAILPVDLAGLPCDMEKLRTLADEAGVAIVEDAAHAFPAAFGDGRPVGSVADATCFSFYATKTITTGEGGMLTTDDDEIEEACRSLALHGITRNAWNRYGPGGSWFYEISRVGYKYNMPDTAAALGLAQLQRAQSMRDRRAEIARIYSDGLREEPAFQLPVKVDDPRHAIHLYMLRLNLADTKLNRANFVEELSRRNIGTSVHFIPLHIHPFYRERYGFQPHDFPIALREYQREISLPIYSAMSNADARDVVSALKDIVHGPSKSMSVVPNDKWDGEPLFLSPPHMTGKEEAYVREAFQTNWVAPEGPQVSAFEQEFSRVVGSQAASAVNSGTAALHLALRLVGVKEGDDVIVPTFTFAATAFPVLYLNARPVLIDSERDSWNMDPNLLEEALHERAQQGRQAAAVVPVHIYGQSANMDRIVELCERYRVPFIEDAAEALGASYAGRHVGTFGRIGIFSFNGNKVITTSAGGMLVSDELDLVKASRKLAKQAREDKPHYEHVEIGYNYRMSNVLAGIGRAQLTALPERVAARRRHFDQYVEALADLPGVKFMPEAQWGIHSRWLTTLTVDPKLFGAENQDIQRALAEEKIESRPLWKPLHQQTVFTGVRKYGGAVADELFEKGVSLPSGSSLTETDLHRVAEIIRKVHVNSKCTKSKSRIETEST